MTSFSYTHLSKHIPVLVQKCFCSVTGFNVEVQLSPVTHTAPATPWAIRPALDMFTDLRAPWPSQFCY